MKKAYFLSIFVLLLAMAGCSIRHNSNVLVDLSDESALKEITSDADVKVSQIIVNGKKIVELQCADENPASSVVFHAGKKNWSLSKYQYLAVDIMNTGKEDVVVECRPAEDAWLGSGQIIPAGKTRSVRTPIIRDLLPGYLTKKLFGMNALPGGIIKMWANLDPDSINRFSVVMINAPKGSTINVCKIAGEGEFTFPTDKELSSNYFPLLDEFGQLIKKEWKGKIHSFDELVKSKEIEAEDLKIGRAPSDWDKYGGWINGPQLKATGSFRTEKVEGKWWLVDPDGRLFWSHGMGTVMLDEATPVTDRQHYFSKLPDSIRFKEFYEIQSYSPKGYYKGRSMKVFKSYSRNLSVKYGNDWRSYCSSLAHERLKSWAMNTIGGWSDPGIFGMSRTPYTETLSSNSRRIEGSEGQWYKFPDPYDISLSEALKNGIARIKKSADDPWCIGYFVDNELYWGDNSYIAQAAVRSGKDQPAKLAMLEFLKKRYYSIEKLNALWSTTFKSWDAFLENTNLPAVEPCDFKDISEMIANQYFKVIKETLKEEAPQKLYLGCRFDFHYYPNEDTTGAWAVRIAAKYCDVVSFNRYRYSAADLVPADADKPIMIGEWHMGALDRGMLHFSLRFADDQDNRAEMYDYYINSCLKNPYIVGAHWFEYVDEPVLGRFDGENYNTGFLDVCDNPYPEMVSAARSIGRKMYSIRSLK